MIVVIGTRLAFVLIAGSGDANRSSWLWLFPIMMIGLMILMFFLGPRKTMQSEGANDVGSEESASEILARRFARRELTKQQYEEMDKTLREHAPPAARGHG